MTRRHLVALSATIGGLLILGIAATAQPNPWAQLGEAYRSTPGDTAAVARVDGAPISRADLRMNVALSVLNNAVSPTKTSEDPRVVLQRVVQTRALAAEAARRGFALTPSEVTQYIANVRAQFAAAPQARAELADFLAGTGLTADAFFSSDFARIHYAESAAIGRLRASIVSGLSSDAANAAWDAFTAQVQRSAHVDVLDATLR